MSLSKQTIENTSFTPNKIVERSKSLKESLHNIALRDAREQNKIFAEVLLQILSELEKIENGRN